MQTRSSSSTILIIIMLVLTAPIWLAIGGAMIGVVFGVLGGIVGAIFGTIFGIFGAVIGAIAGLITLPFKIIFGGDWYDYHLSGKAIFGICLIVLLIAALKRRSQ